MNIECAHRVTTIGENGDARETLQLCDAIGALASERAHIWEGFLLVPVRPPVRFEGGENCVLFSWTGDF